MAAVADISGIMDSYSVARKSSTPISLLDKGTTEPLTLPTLEELFTPSPTDPVPDHPTLLFILDEGLTEPLALPTLEELFTPSPTDPVPDHPTLLFILDERLTEPLALPN